MDSGADTAEAVGCPIRRPTDRCLLAAPRGFSQRAASFVASQCQGIHQMPLFRLISALAPRAGTGPRSRPLRIQMRPGHAPSPRGDGPTAGHRSLRLLPLHDVRRSRPPPSGGGQGRRPDDRRRRFEFPSGCVCGHGRWWRRTGSNRRPHACKARALPTELRPRRARTDLVGQGGLEPPTSRLSSARSNRLSY